MSSHSILDWISVLGPVLLSWPLVITVALLFFYRPLYDLLDKFSSNNIQKAKIGPIEIEEAEQTYVESLKFLLTSFVSEQELNHLKQLNTEGDSVPYESTTDLIMELKRLSTLNFIAAKSHLDQLPKEGDLKHHIELTSKGKQYLRLRDNLSDDQTDSAEQKE
ncbi:MAG: hypothetical protein KME47_18115 [Nodosilinea sp. WJT8-NPBG4]|nr:hypothetical protein [Nodosilinea sp. WJT8-NPBG4]